MNKFLLMANKLINYFRYSRLVRLRRKINKKKAKLRIYQRRFGYLRKDYKSVAKVKEYVGDLLCRFVTKIFYIHPVVNNRIMFMSFGGTKYSCNPKRISEYLAEHYPGQFEIIWAFKDREKFDWLEEWNGSKTVKLYSLRFFRYALTSKVYIHNMRVPAMIPFRKKQLTIGTGHGGGAYKKLLLDNPTLTNIDKRIQMLSAKSTDLLVSSCTAYTKYVIKGAFGHTGDYIECGMPRNDELILDGNNQEMREYIRRYYDIPKENKIILYAPTYRKGKRAHATDYDLDVAGIVEAAKKRFGGEWSIMYRMHYFIENRLPETSNNQHIVDATDYYDMQDLLIASDLLITDYSSSVWDYGLMNKPCFLYTVDLVEYLEEQGFYYDVQKWPFPLAIDNEKLVENIEHFNQESYDHDVKEHYRILGSVEKGTATKTLGEKIYKECFGE